MRRSPLRTGSTGFISLLSVCKTPRQGVSKWGRREVCVHALIRCPWWEINPALLKCIHIENI